MGKRVGEEVERTERGRGRLPCLPVPHAHDHAHAHAHAHTHRQRLWMPFLPIHLVHFQEVSSITLRSPSSLVGEHPSHAITDAVDRFMRSDVGIRTRYELAWKTEVRAYALVVGAVCGELSRPPFGSHSPNPRIFFLFSLLQGHVDAGEVRALRSLCEHQRGEADSITSMLNSTCDELDQAVASLSRRVKSTAPARTKSRNKAK